MSAESHPGRSMKVADFDFDLPKELIAQEPPAERGTSRMLVMDRATGVVRDSVFSEFPSMLRPGDVLVLNDSRVIPARLYGYKTSSGVPSFRPPLGERVGRQLPGARIEVLLTEPTGESHWCALVKPGRKVMIGDRLQFLAENGEVMLEAKVVKRGDFGERVLEFLSGEEFFEKLERIGHMPLPPYIRRSDEAGDRERYQTVFARDRGSVAAPTAGLHLTPQILEEIARCGVEIARITLHVGLGTFAPLRAETLDEVHLHRERYTIAAETADALSRAIREGRRIVAVGTTVVRTLESVARRSQKFDFEPHFGTTDIFISPGFEFRVVGALLTNFHLPQSSLLMLVSAFAGRERILAAYKHAVERDYRFFSYGDCMFIA